MSQKQRNKFNLLVSPVNILTKREWGGGSLPVFSTKGMKVFVWSYLSLHKLKISFHAKVFTKHLAICQPPC